MIRSMQINLQHSRVATYNSMNLIKQDCKISYSYKKQIFQNETAGITRNDRNYISTDNRSRTVK